MSSGEYDVDCEKKALRQKISLFWQMFFAILFSANTPPGAWVEKLVHKSEHFLTQIERIELVKYVCRRFKLSWEPAVPKSSVVHILPLYLSAWYGLVGQIFTTSLAEPSVHIYFNLLLPTSQTLIVPKYIFPIYRTKVFCAHFNLFFTVSWAKFHTISEI